METLGRCLCSVHRRLTSRQQSLILSYAEDETDVEGTVNGVTQTSAGKMAQRLVGVQSVPQRMGGLEASSGFHLGVFTEPPKSPVESG